MEPTIKEIEGFLKDYEEENAQGGMPLMAEEIYIKHVKFLLSHIEKLEIQALNWEEENEDLRKAIEEHHDKKTLRSQGFGLELYRLRTLAENDWIDMELYKALERR